MKPYASHVNAAVQRFTAQREEPFSAEEVIDAVAPMLEEDEEDIPALVLESLTHDPHCLLDYQKNQFVPRAYFFKGKKFLIQPTAEEVAGGYLIAGHRFMPFQPWGFHPSDSTITTRDGATIGTRLMPRSLMDAQIYFSLLHPGRLFAYLVGDDPDNADPLETAEGLEIPLNLRVFDLNEWFARTGFRVGDAMLMTVTDWREGGYILEHKPAGNKRGITEWSDQFEETLLDMVLEVLGPATNIYEQLSLTYFFGPKSLGEEPRLHLGGFLSHMQELQLTKMGGEPMFWYRGQSADAALMDMAIQRSREPGPKRNTTNSIDDICAELGLAFGEEELEAYMRDSLFHGEKDVNDVLERCLRSRGSITFNSQEQGNAFWRHAEDLWVKVSQGYNRFADQRAGKCRAEGLKILDQALTWMDQMGADAELDDDNHKKQYVALSGMTAVLTEMIISLNGEDLNQEEINHLRAGIDQIASRLRSGVEMIKPPPEPGRQRPVFRVIEGGMARPESVYLLRVNLVSAEPPLWRLIEVSGRTNFDMLGTILAAAMSLEQEAPFQFHLADSIVGKARPGVSDAHEVLLQKALSQGDQFHFEYGTHENWLHLIEVERVAGPEESEHYPRCLEGQGAHEEGRIQAGPVDTEAINEVLRGA